MFFFNLIKLDGLNVFKTKNQSFEFQILNDFNYDLYFFCHSFGVPIFLVSVETQTQKIFYSSVNKLWCDEVNKTDDNSFKNTGYNFFINSGQLYKASNTHNELNLNTENYKNVDDKKGSLL